MHRSVRRRRARVALVVVFVWLTATIVMFSVMAGDGARREGPCFDALTFDDLEGDCP